MWLFFNSLVSSICSCSVSKWCYTLCNSHGLQHTRLPCPSLSPGVCSDLRPLRQWCYLTMSCPATPFSVAFSVSQHSGSFPVSQLFTSGGLSIGVSTLASVLSMNIQDWFSLGLTGLISLQSKWLGRVFSSTTIQKYQFFSSQSSLWVQLSNSYMTTGKKP